MYQTVFKRLIDFVISFVAIILFTPLIIIITCVLVFINKGKPFFFQKRPGKNEVIFKIIKFKSMNDKKDAHGVLLPFEQRITKTGKFIRKYSLDEIPQLLNVLKGDMSFIGPRPLLVSYLLLYNSEQQLRHSIKPGITGWAQINGRNTISWNEKFKFDIWYAKNISLKTDFKIILLTIKKVILKEDINSNQIINMPTFNGNN